MLLLRLYGAKAPSFLDCLARTATPVFRELRSCPASEPEALSVLSPFHDQNGESVCELAAAITSRQTRVIASMGPKGPVSTFPFGPKLKTKVDSFVLVTNDKRPVHAKWIEITHKEGKVTLTGSVNATRSALSTTHNVEVGILRHQAVGFRGPFKLRACPLPARTRVDFLRR
jgi:hypothetical protein